MKNLLLLLVLFSCSVLSANNVMQGTHSDENNANIDTQQLNQILKDPRVGEQFISVYKNNIEQSIAYSFVDRQSITLHPYNKKIRVFTEIVNYLPSLVIEQTDGTKTPYRSMVIQQMANCDKMEVVKGKINLYENYFGDGKLLSTNNFPKRWESIGKGNDSRRLLVIACDLPLAK